MKFAIIIPASMGSKRLPGKPLLPIGGRTMLEWVITGTSGTKAEAILVATSDHAVYHACGKTACHQSKQRHHSGTSRCAEALGAIDPSVELIVNWQVDEPFLEAEHVNELVEMVSGWSPEKQQNTIGTITAPGGADRCPHCSYGMRMQGNSIHPCPECYGGRRMHVVKAARSIVDNRCHWFSRAPMPGAVNHVGVYCYHRSLLEKLGRIPQSLIAAAEGLEQLDWLVAGCNIESTLIQTNPLSINTFHDYERAMKRNL